MQVAALVLHTLWLDTVSPDVATSIVPVGCLDVLLVAASYRVGTFFDRALAATIGFRSAVRHCHTQLAGRDVLAVGRSLLWVSIH